MPAFPFESHILKLATLRGYVSAEALEDCMALGQYADSGQEVFSPLAKLIARGILTPATINRLTEELLREPLFTPTSFQEEDFVDPASEGDPSQSWKGYGDLTLLERNNEHTLFQARDLQLNRPVVLQLPRIGPWQRLTAFLESARHQAKIDHPNVIKVYEVGEQRGQPYIAMQSVQGRSLAEVRKSISQRTAMELLIQVCEGVYAAHLAGGVSLSIDPDHILIDEQNPDKPNVYLRSCVEEITADNPAVLVTDVPTAKESQDRSQVEEYLRRHRDVEALGRCLQFIVHENQPSPNNTSSPAPLSNTQQSILHTSKDLECILAKCIHPDPLQRYSTALAVAADLRRFLHGEPVLARNGSWFYKLSKWVERQRVPVAVAVIGIISLIIIGGWSWRRAQRIDRQSRLAERYALEVRSIEELLRCASLSRIHDRRPTMRLLENAMDQIRSDMKRLGPEAEGPGCFALGEGLWIMEDPDEARKELDRAWALGFRTPACAQTRGQVLAILYQREKNAIVTESSQEREKILFRLATEFRDPALECFSIARSKGLNAPFQEAMEAYLKDDIEAALARTETALEQTPWLYEMSVLRGKLFISLANARRAEGRAEEAIRFLQKAGQALDQATEIAPSDPSNWDEKGWYCYVMADQADLPINVQMKWTEQAKFAFEQALKADPDHISALGGLGQYCRRRADLAVAQNLDPMPFLDQGIRFGESALMLSHSQESFLESDLTWSLTSRGQERLYRGLDARPDLDRAISCLRASLKYQVEFEGLHGLDTALLYRAFASFADHEDPLPYLREAVRMAEAASQVDSYYPFIKAAALARRFDLAEFEIRLGLSSSEPLRPLLKQFEAVVKGVESEPDIRSTLASAYSLIGRTAGSIEESRTAFLNAQRIRDAALAKSPEDADCLEGAAFAALAFGARLRHHGLSPVTAYEHGLSAARTLSRIRKNYDLPKAMEAALRLRLAQYSDDRSTVLREAKRLREIKQRNHWAGRMIETSDGEGF